MAKLFQTVLLIGSLSAFLSYSAEPAGAKKLIEFGWDEPSPAFMREHIAEMEKTPFDGCVFHVDYKRADGGSGSFTWEGWGSRKFEMTELQKAVQDLEATHFQRFKYNFLRFNTTPAKLDWFDDFSAVLNNAELAARIAREGKCAGLLFDTEQYDGALFNYRKQRDAATKSWDEYAIQARKRGREVMHAFQEGYSNLTVFLTFAYSLPWAQCGGNKQKLADAGYGLLAPFLDGLFEAASGKTKIVDGYEISYGYKQPSQFETAYETMKQKLLPIVVNSKSYESHLSIGFGVWMDRDWRKRGWDTNDFAKNYFTPESLGTSLSAALERADEYVWLYTETPRWWSEAGSPQKLPPAYDAALRKVRSSAH